MSWKDDYLRMGPNEIRYRQFLASYRPGTVVYATPAVWRRPDDVLAIKPRYGIRQNAA